MTHIPDWWHSGYHLFGMEFNEALAIIVGLIFIGYIFVSLKYRDESGGGRV